MHLKHIYNFKNFRIEQQSLLRTFLKKCALLIIPQIGKKYIIDFGEYLVPNQFKNDELLIKVHSASLNPIDFKFHTTKLPFYRWICFPNLGIGMDFSGEVVKIGDLVTKYRIGDSVFGFACIGTFQEYTITK